MFCFSLPTVTTL